MIEPLRSQYLVALGIENYVPRFVLPGAKLSEPCAWLEAPAEAADSVEQLADSSVAEPVAAVQARTESTPEKPTHDIAQRTPAIDATKRPVRAGENIPAKSQNVQIEAGPQFALSIVLAGGGVLLIDAAPASSAERSAFQQLLNNMLPALRPAAAQYVLDIFIWPLTRQPKVPRDADAAIEALAAYLNKQIAQRTIDTVLLLGEVAQRWCTFENGVRVIKSSSLLACVQNPTLKRALWNDIRHLGER